MRRVRVIPCVFSDNVQDPDLRILAPERPVEPSRGALQGLRPQPGRQLYRPSDIVTVQKPQGRRVPQNAPEGDELSSLEPYVRPISVSAVYHTD